MSRAILIICGLCLSLPLPAQWLRASLAEDGSTRVTSAPAPAAPAPAFRGEEIRQLPGFPKAYPAHSAFKNLRNVTLADLDGRPGEEIIWASNDRLFVYNSEGLLWERALTGVAIYPPSAADLDGDGRPEIVQVTGGLPAAGRVYVMNAEGVDLPGWPLRFNDNWIANAATLVDVDDDGILEIVVNELAGAAGRVHLLRLDGTPFSPAWPVTLGARPAVTPSAADIDGDGEIDIVVFSTESRYVFGLDGRPKPGWPQRTHPQQRYSFQSPILADFDGQGQRHIVGATHGDNLAPLPFYFVLEPGGEYRPGWPQQVPELSWTYSTPSVVELPDGGPAIFMSRPIGPDSSDMLYAWTPGGALFPGFPIIKPGGLEGVIGVADLDGDGAQDLVFGSNMADASGRGFLHAYRIGAREELPGFPLRPRGFTYMNGPALGDITGDGRMELAALSYTQNFGQGVDSVYLNVYALPGPVHPGAILWGTYKGDNRRDGRALSPLASARLAATQAWGELSLWPNPCAGAATLRLRPARAQRLELQLWNLDGRLIRRLFEGYLPAETRTLPLDLSALAPGMYLLRALGEAGAATLRVLKTGGD
jgi:hypothetical protein